MTVVVGVLTLTRVCVCQALHLGLNSSYWMGAVEVPGDKAVSLRDECKCIYSVPKSDFCVCTCVWTLWCCVDFLFLQRMNVHWLQVNGKQSDPNYHRCSARHIWRPERSDNVLNSAKKKKEKESVSGLEKMCSAASHSRFSRYIWCVMYKLTASHALMSTSMDLFFSEGRSQHR